MEMFGIYFAVLALAVGSVIAAGVAFLIFRRRANSLAITLIVFAAPSLFVALWLTGCYSLQQIESAEGHKHFWFFEAACPLTGGYDLTFDEKFKLGAIARHGEPSEDGPVQTVGAVQVLAPAIAGEYTEGFEGLEPDRFFLFDTRTGNLENFDSRAELETKLGRAIALRTLDETYDAAR